MIKTGMILGDRYEILGKIGSGGMSDVFKARDHKLNREVAIKVLKQEFNSDSSFIAKFRTEAHAAASLCHPNIVQVFDVGDEEDYHYIVMELVEGITLKTYISKKGKLEIRETIGIALQVSQGIEAAHEQNIIHRDIKPQNIIISRDGKVKVTDFGIAKAATSETVTSNTMGSVHYISPEQARGGYCDARSDIYSLGITMYEMLTGKVPFEGDSAVSIALLHIQGDMVPPAELNPAVPVSLNQIILKCTQKKAEMRYRNMAELIADLKHALMAPNDNFVKMNVISSTDPTIVMSSDEVNQIRGAAAAKSVDATELLPPVKEDRYDDWEEEERYQLGYDDDELLPEDEEDYDDYDDSKKSDKIYMIIGIGVAVLILVLALFIVGKTFGWFDFGSSKIPGAVEQTLDGKEVSMPALVGKTLEEAEKLMKDENLEIKLDYKESKEYAEGVVMEQEIAEGTPVKPHTAVKITISKGTTETTVPDNLVGMTKEQAQDALKAASLEASFDEIFSDEQPVGRVAKVSPGQGQVCTMGSTVTVYISKGPATKTTTMPKLLGLSRSKAESALAEAKLELGEVTKEYSEDYPEGQIMDQSVKSGKTVEEGTAIDIVISRGANTVTMPGVLGLDQAGAKAALEAAGLTLGSVGKKNSNEDEGTVVSAEYDYGDKLKAGTSVDIWISIGPREEPTDPAPTDPAPTDPAPTDPAPTDPAPTDPASEGE